MVSTSLTCGSSAPLVPVAQHKAFDLFTRSDRSGDGRLTMYDLSAFLRALLPRLDKKEIRWGAARGQALLLPVLVPARTPRPLSVVGARRFALSHLHFLDTDGDGLYTWPDVLHGCARADGQAS